MKAIRKAVLSWWNLTVPVKIMPLIGSEVHLIPKEIDVHQKCNQDVTEAILCPSCKKVFKAKVQVSCPECHRTFEPEIQNLCSECKSKVKEPIIKKWCPTCKKQITDKVIKKVFPVGEDQLMELSDKEIEQWEKNFPDKEKINVGWVTRKREINPVYFLTTYTLVPDKKGEYGYEFFRQMLADNELVLIADVVISKNNYRAIISHENGRLLLITLVNYDEIEWPDVPPVQLPAELVEKGKDFLFKLADRQFRPEEHARDPYREYFQMLVAKKVEKREVAFRPPLVPSPEVQDEITKQLMASLLSVQQEIKKEEKKALI